MMSVQQRQNLLSLIDQACADGARLKPACRQIGLSCRSVQRWQRTDAAEGDQRQSGKRRYACPTNKLREDERQAVMATLNSEAFFGTCRPARSCLGWLTAEFMWRPSPRCTGCCDNRAS